MPIKLVVGLGNHGESYALDRHNAGFWFVDELAKKLNIKFSKKSQFSAEVAEFLFKEHKIFIIKPTTFMNRSGIAVSSIMNYFNIKPEEIIVVHDELDLNPGEIKIKTKGGSAGHNGLKDLISALSSTNFCRLRIGVGKNEIQNKSISDYVLSPPSKAQKLSINLKIKDALDIMELIIVGRLEEAMNILHRKENGL